MNVKSGILKEIAHTGPKSRAELSRILGVCPSRITEVCASLLDQGALCPCGYREGYARGRKNLLLDIDCSYKFALGVGISKDIICVGLTTLKGEALGKELIEAKGELNFWTVYDAVKTAANKILRECCLSKEQILGIGVSMTASAVTALNIDISDGLLPEGYRAADGIPMLFEPLDDYLEYAGQYLNISPDGLYMFGCAKVTRDLFIYGK